mgnify:FL=1
MQRTDSLSMARSPGKSLSSFLKRETLSAPGSSFNSFLREEAKLVKADMVGKGREGSRRPVPVCSCSDFAGRGLCQY